MLHRLNVAGLDLNHVQALHHLLEEAHVARAAKKLSITPAAASNALRRLREELGDELLTRDGSGLVRTTLGEQLLEPAREVIAAAERLFAVAIPFDPATFDGDVPIATSDRVAGALLANLDATLRASAPRACLRIRSIPPDLADWSRTTFGVVIGAMEDEALSSEVLFRERYVLLVRTAIRCLDGASPSGSTRLPSTSSSRLERAPTSGTSIVRSQPAASSGASRGPFPCSPSSPRSSSARIASRRCPRASRVACRRRAS